MQLSHSEAGVSLMELMLAVTLVTAVVLSLSVAFPRVSTSSLQGRQHAVADQLAESAIETLKNKPYAFLDTSDTTLGASFNTNCNCSTISDFSPFTSTNTVVANSTFTAISCINYASPGTPNWTSQCAAAGDTGHKNIVVYVSWMQGNQACRTSQESMVSR